MAEGQTLGQTGRGSRRRKSRLEPTPSPAPADLARATGGLSAPDPMRVFGRMRGRDVRSLASPVLHLTISSGTELIREDDEAGTFYVIRSGSAELSRTGTVVRTLGPGDCFGETDPEAPQRQPFTVTAASELSVLAFSAVGVARLCMAVPEAHKSILAHLPAPLYMLPPPERSRRAAGSSTVIAR